jgi:hypothetical protein
VQPAEILLNRVFTKENTTSSLRESSSPFFLQEFRPLTPLKETYRFTSLTVIGMTKIMCNTHLLLVMSSLYQLSSTNIGMEFSSVVVQNDLLS